MRELMALPIDDIRFEDVVAFCAHQTPENQRLDYKEEFSSRSPGKQIAKVVAAFANTQGGTLLFGVDEEDDRKPNCNPVGAELGSNPKATIQSACAHNIFPPVIPEVTEFIVNPNDNSRGFLVVRIPVSEDIHSVDGGTGIYLRVNDQSEPVRATLDQIEWLIQRKQRAVEFQRQTRERGLTRLREAINSSRQRGVVEVSIGPKAITEPTMDRSILRSNAMTFSVPSYCFNHDRTPIISEHSIKAVSNGIYTFDSEIGQHSEATGMIDIFGNIMLITRLSRERTLDQRTISETLFAQLPKENDNHVGIDIAHLVERLLCVIRSAVNVYNFTGFVGLVELTFNTTETKKFPLVYPSARSDHVLGICPLDNNVFVQQEYTTMDLNKNVIDLLKTFVVEILWSWGRVVEEQDAIRAIDMAEQYHYGSTTCTCNRTRPNSRETCLHCRLN